MLNLHQRLIKAQQRLFERKKQGLGESVRLLNTLSPLNTLERGYALITDANTQKVITNSTQVMPGTTIKARIAQGELLCTVETIKS